MGAERARDGAERRAPDWSPARDGGAELSEQACAVRAFAGLQVTNHGLDNSWPSAQNGADEISEMSVVSAMPRFLDDFDKALDPRGILNPARVIPS